MFRALNHEGVAAECLFALAFGDQKMTSERRMSAFVACAVIAKTMQRVRELKVLVLPHG